MKYIFPFKDANTINKYGVNITLYDENVATNNLVYEETEFGHLEEFYNDVSTHMWFIIEGQGTFVIDGEKVEAGPKDLVVVPPKKKVHYFGKMKMVLCVSPAWDEKNEHYVRDVPIEESPYHA